MAKKVSSTPSKPVTLVLPAVTRISNDVDAMIESTVAERFTSISLVLSGEKDTAKNVPVLTHLPDTKDANTQISTWNSELGHLLRLTQAMINAWSSGAGYSGDGSCVYVLKNADTALKAVPNFMKYDIHLVPSGRAGCKQYRISVPEMLSQIKNRGTIIEACVKAFGVAAGKKRTKKSSEAPQITYSL